MFKIAPMINTQQHKALQLIENLEDLGGSATIVD
jgi:hypothetical protein